MRYPALFGLGLILLVLAAGGAYADKRVALVIGNSTYTSVPALPNPQNDALDISVALEGLGFDVQIGLNLSNDGMKQIAEKFAGAARGADVALFYYAGHGFQVNENNYLVPIDANFSSVADVPEQAVAVNQILHAMQVSKGVKLVFLDACRDNPFGAALEHDPEAGSGLARAGTEANFLFAYATQPDNVAYDGVGRNSFFTEAMLHHIFTPGQDISELMISVRRDVLAATGGQQIPWENSSLTRQFVFDESPASVSEETMFYQVASSVKDPRLLQLYVDTYPQGAHVGEAERYLTRGTATRTLDLGDPAQQEEKLWTLARRSRLRSLLEYYVERYPNGPHRFEADQLISMIPRLEDASPGALCERLATHPRDATAGNAGVPFATLQNHAVAAIQACSVAATQSPNLPHYIALLARATAASGDMSRAIELYKAAAQRGDLRAMVSLAQLKENGTGMEQDIKGAMALYQAAAGAGSHDAMINLALSLLQGQGLPKDTDRAIALLEQASREGSPKATYNLGVLALDGIAGKPEDALGYFRRAANAGAYEGYRAAAILLDEGRGVPRDAKAAANLLLRGVAEDDGSLMLQLTEGASNWGGETLRQVQERLASAGLYTDRIDGLPGPKFSAALEKWRNGGFNAALLQD